MLGNEIFEISQEKETNDRGGWKGLFEQTDRVNSSQIVREISDGWLRSGKIKRARCCRSGDRRNFLYRSELLIEESRREERN